MKPLSFEEFFQEWLNHKPQEEDVKELENRERGYIEGYAAALQDILLELPGENDCNKSYDPMTISDGVMHSYAFNMKDGGRHHQIDDYESIDEIKEILLEEVVDCIISERDYVKSVLNNQAEKRRKMQANHQQK